MRASQSRGLENSGAHAFGSPIPGRECVHATQTDAKKRTRARHTDGRRDRPLRPAETFPSPFRTGGIVPRRQRASRLITQNQCPAERRQRRASISSVDSGGRKASSDGTSSFATRSLLSSTCFDRSSYFFVHPDNVDQSLDRAQRVTMVEKGQTEKSG